MVFFKTSKTPNGICIDPFFKHPKILIMNEINDESPMPVGWKFRGVKMKDIPDSYLEWFYEKTKYTLYKKRRYPVLAEVCKYAEQRLKK